MENRYYQWKHLNFLDLYKTKRNSVYNPEKKSVDEFKRNLLRLNKFYKKFFSSKDDPVGLIIYSDAGLSLGSLLIFVQSSKKLEINPWELRGHPWIQNHQDNEKILPLLLKNVVNYAEENGYNSIELSITKEDDKSFDYKRYEQNGFEFHHETTGMNINLEELPPLKITIPTNFNIKNFDEIDHESFFNPYYETLKDNKTHYFYDQNLEECKNFYTDSIMRSDELRSESSFAIFEKNKVVGFSFVMEYSNNFHFIDWVGIHPNYRGKGYGKLLMSFLIHKAKEKGAEGIGLSCDVQNEVAYSLYSRIGFIPDEREITLSWLKNRKIIV